MNRKISAISLLELLISVVIFSIIAIGISNIDFFSRAQVLSAERRAALQNEIYLVLEDMSKNVSKAIGSVRADGAASIVNVPPGGNISGDPAIRAYIDLNNAGTGPGDGRRNTQGDRWIAYRFTGETGNPNTRFQVWHYDNYVNPASAYAVVGRNIAFDQAYWSGNSIVVGLTSCRDPGAPMSISNPCITSKGNIYLPSVSTN